MSTRERRVKVRGPKGKVVATTDEMKHGGTKKFLLRCRGERVEGFLVGFKGGVYAYVNRCRHIPISLDWVDNQFFTEDNRYLMCANHGAMYEPTTGACHWGPCFGAFLQKVPLRISGGKILALCPCEEDAGGDV